MFNLIGSQRHSSVSCANIVSPEEFAKTGRMSIRFHTVVYNTSWYPLSSKFHFIFVL